MLNLSVPQIPVPESEDGRSFNYRFFTHLPAMPEFGNMGLKNFDIAQRHHFVNGLLREIFYDHTLEKTKWHGDIYTIDHLFFKIKNQTETVIYWLRKTVDDLIGIAWFVYNYHVKEVVLEKIDIDCIGRLTNCTDHDFLNIFRHNMPQLEVLNNVSNSLKHSILQYETMYLIGQEEPTVVALHLKQNDGRKVPEYYSLSLKNVIADYINFYQLTWQQIKSWMDEKLQNAIREHEKNPS